MSDSVFSVASGIGDDLVILGYGDVSRMEVLLIELRAKGNLLLQHENLLPHLADAEELLCAQFTEGFYGYCHKDDCSSAYNALRPMKSGL